MNTIHKLEGYLFGLICANFGCKRSDVVFTAHDELAHCVGDCSSPFNKEITDAVIKFYRPFNFFFLLEAAPGHLPPKKYFHYFQVFICGFAVKNFSGFHDY